ncbi:hypothetical protein ACF0H5_000884 [Mactra antiquata]
MNLFGLIFFLPLLYQCSAVEFDITTLDIDKLLENSAAFKQLKERVSYLEDRDLGQQHLISKLRNDVAKQQQENAILRETVAGLKSMLDNKNSATENLSLPHKILNDEALKNHKPKRMSSDKSLRQRREMIRKQAPFGSVAFSAGLSKSMLHAGAHQNIIFDTVQSNIGNGYNSHHGVFTAPQEGTYVFHSSILAYNNREVWCRFVINGTPSTAIYARGTDNRHDQGAQMIIVSLNQGDDVSVQNTAADDAIYGDASIYTTFSGFLLQGESEAVIG